MKRRKKAWIALLSVLCLTLSGCRTRTGIHLNMGQEYSDDRAENAGVSDSDSSPEEQEKNGEPGGQTKENPDASRKEYDETRPAELIPGTERTVHGSGEGSGLSAAGEETDRKAAKLNETAEQTVTRTLAAEEAEQTGISEDAEEADSARIYYSVLLQERAGSLFECQRLNVYWETMEDHVTIFRTSPEHTMILNAGAYDVSARLLEENLHVDDGWIGRKNPGVIVKVVDAGVLGTGVSSTAAAQRVYADLSARDGWAAIDAVRNGRVILLSEEMTEVPHLQLAVMLIIAKTANPELYADTEMDQALTMLAEEAAGMSPSGIFWYNGSEGLR